MNIIDISWPVESGMTEYKDRNTLKIEPIKQFESDGVRESMIMIHSHTGTHIDAPSHFLLDGKTSGHVSLDSLIGKCRVLDLTHVSEKVSRQDLEKNNLQAGERILLKTKNSDLAWNAPFDYHFIYLSIEAAQYCADNKIALIGIDYLGIERTHVKHEVHTILLGAGVVILEGLRLKETSARIYELLCLPLKIAGCDGLPARAVLKT